MKIKMNGKKMVIKGYNRNNFSETVIKKMNKLFIYLRKKNK